MIRLLDRVLNFFLSDMMERRQAKEELRKTAAFSQSLDMWLIAYSMARTENLHRIIRGMVEVD